ncbi:MAG: oligosaccharide flippase family protein [Candidatus Falkowbacteria bacterium]
MKLIAKVKTLWADNFLRGTMFLSVVNFFGAFLNYLVHPILARHLSVAQYGDYQALLSFITLLGLMAGVVSCVITREVSSMVDRQDQIDVLRRKINYYLSGLGIIIFLLVLAAVPFLNTVFKVSHGAALAFASLFLLFFFPLTVNRAVLSGLQKFTALSGNTILDQISRLVLIVLLVIVWPLQIVGAGLALGLSSVPALAVGFWQIKKLQLPKGHYKSPYDLRSLWRYGLLAILFSVLLQFFYNFDMLFVKAWFSPEEAGLYGALLTIGRIAYFIGGAVPMVMFPVVASFGPSEAMRKYKTLGKSLLLMALMMLPVAGVMIFWPSFVINFVVGAKYLSMAPYLPLFTAVIFLLTFMTVVGQYYLALARRSALYFLLSGAILEIICLGIFHDSLYHFIWALFIAFTINTLGLMVLLGYDYWHDKKYEK